MCFDTCSADFKRWVDYLVHLAIELKDASVLICPSKNGFELEKPQPK